MLHAPKGQGLDLIDLLMKAIPLLLLLSLVLLLVLLQCPANAGFRIGLTHVDSNDNNMALEELVKRAVDRSKYRMALVQAKLSNSTFDVQVPIHFGGNVIAYYMDLAIGTPPLPITAEMDTGSDLVWTQCQPCVQCVPQKTTIYDPSKSSTFTQIPCATPLCQAFGAEYSRCDGAGNCIYFYSYGDNSSTQGVLGSETFTLGDGSIDDIGFGCGLKNAGATGFVGLGQGKLSLPSQLNTSKFSYCLSVYSNSSLLLLGPSASLNGSTAGTVQSTPFLSDTNYYYISLQGISLGATLLPIPSAAFQYNANGTGGTIIDSGTSLTFLQQRAYDVLKQEIVSLVKMPVVNIENVDLDLCFKVTSWPPPSMPDMTFHFDGADMTVPPENYLVGDRRSGLLCLLILPSSFPVSILGNLLQQNMHLLYDLDNRMLSFVPAQCDQL